MWQADQGSLWAQKEHLPGLAIERAVKVKESVIDVVFDADNLILSFRFDGEPLEDFSGIDLPKDCTFYPVIGGWEGGVESLPVPVNRIITCSRERKDEGGWFAVTCTGLGGDDLACIDCGHGESVGSLRRALAERLGIHRTIISLVGSGATVLQDDELVSAAAMAGDVALEVPADEPASGATLLEQGTRFGESEADAQAGEVSDDPVVTLC